MPVLRVRGWRRSPAGHSVIGLAVLAALWGCSYSSQYSPAATDAEQPVLQKSVERTDRNLVLVNGAKLNHETTILGIFCSAHHYHDDFQSYFQAYLEALDADGTVPDVDDVPASASETVIEVSDAHSDYRCVETGTFRSECSARKMVSVKITVPGASGATPLERSYQVEGSNPKWGCSTFAEAFRDLGNQIMEQVENDIRSLG